MLNIEVCKYIRELMPTQLEKTLMLEKLKAKGEGGGEDEMFG